MNKEYGICVKKQYLGFCAAHFLVYGPDSREPLHGHNYHATVSLDGLLTERRDLVVDFRDIKPMLKAICREFDDCLLLPTENENLAVSENGAEVIATTTGGERFVFPRKDVALLPINNTTAELIAELIYRRLLPKLAAQYPTAKLRAIRIDLEEAKGQSASYGESFETARTLAEFLA